MRRSRIRAALAALSAVMAGTLLAGCADFDMAAAGPPSTMPTPAATAPSGTFNWGASSPPGLPGLDVSGWQQNVDWTQKGDAQFVYIKDTEGTSYTSSYFPGQWTGAGAVGLLRGAYHFADPSPTSSGKAQANYFFQQAQAELTAENTLPPVLDIEYDDQDDGKGWCWGMKPAAMVTWIKGFLTRLTALTGRTPAIYTAPSWWEECTGNSTDFTSYPLWISDYSSAETSVLPGGWTSYPFRQYEAGASRTAFPGDRDVFTGTTSQLAKLAHWFQATAVPVVTGAAEVGETLTADAGAWSPVPTSFSYQWSADGLPIPGATSATLALTAAQLGTAITVAVTAHKGHYPLTSETSAATASVAPAPLTSSIPTISGKIATERTVHAKHGHWTAGTTFSYQWYAGAKKIKGATAAHLVVPMKLKGKKLSVRVTGVLAGYSTVTAKSPAQPVLGSLKTAKPGLVGVRRVGRTLTALHRTWTKGTVFHYRWYAGKKPIAKAVHHTFVLTKAQLHKHISVRVTGTKKGYLTVTRRSPVSRAVAKR